MEQGHHSVVQRIWLASRWLLPLLGCSGLLAQESGPIFPPSAEPDVRLEQLAPPPTPKLGGGMEVPETAPSRAPAGAEQVRFVLQGLQIDGVTAYSAEEISTLYADKIGSEVSLADVYGIAAEIQRFYRDDGYFLTRAILPPQAARDGRLRILVLEGYISDFHIQGDVGPVESRLRSYLDHLLQERPLRLATLERYLLLAKDLPGVTVNGVLRPAPDEVGAAQLIVTAERKRFEGLALVDNIGSTFTGEWEIAGSVSSNSATAYGEQITLTGLLSDPAEGISNDSENQKVLQLGGSFRPDDKGTYVNLLASYGDSNPGGLISQFEFDSTKLLVSAVAGYPYIRSRSRNVFGEIGFDYIDSDTDVFGGIKFSRDRLRVLHFSGLTDFRDRWRGANFASLSLRQGLPIFGASESGDEFLSRADGNGDFTSIRAAYTRLQPLVDHFGVFATVEGQYAFNSVLSDEEFDVGGVRFGRGYDPKELSGDSGIGFTGEIQYTRPADTEYLDRYQVFGFYDFGNVWQRGIDASASLASAGAGVRAWFARDASVALQVAKPLTRDSQRADDSKDAQVLFRASIAF